jgi:hypothetical protein
MFSLNSLRHFSFRQTRSKVADCQVSPENRAQFAKKASG